MKFGMNLLLWSGELNDGMMPVLEQLKKIGYDGVEVPIFGGDPASFRPWAKRLDDLGFERTAVTIRTEADNPISPDAKIRAAPLNDQAVFAWLAAREMKQYQAVTTKSRP